MSTSIPTSQGDKPITVSTHKKLDAFEDRVLTISGIYTDNQTLLTDAKAVLDAVAVGFDLGSLEDRVKGFAESSKVFMSALNVVAQVHPFIGIAVMAFNAVVSLELKRRDNDRKVIALILQMQKMMSVLGELCNVKDATQKAPDGTTLPGRMQALMAGIAQDIEACGNACDGYAKKHLIVKIVKSSKYEGRLAEFATTFNDRRTELEFALSMHTTLAIDEANRTLSDVNAKIDMIMSFQKLYSPQEKAAQKIVAENGGIQCIDDDGVLYELYLISRSTDRDAGDLSLTKPKKLDTTALAELRKALNEDVDATLKKNLFVFGAKFRMQMEELGQSVKTVVESGTEQLLDAMGRRLHSQIIDPDLHRIWVDMDWKGSVKARHFVLALHDYFQGGFKDHDASSQVDDKGNKVALSTIEPPLGEEDRWALPYIDILHVQPILEAFDDDGTGFISIKEANLFTTSRPKEWSLPQRLAYWAAGWRYTIHQYSSKIAGIIENIFDRLSQIPPENRKMIDSYLNDRTSFRNVEILLRSLNPYRDRFDPALNARFRPHVLAEESRMEQNLLAVGYEIDDANTMQLILGPGRIEQYLFPFLFLVLRRHLQLVKTACKHILHQDELKTATRSLQIIFEVVQARIRNIAAIFEQKNLDVSTQLRTFAYGMFRLLNDSEGLEGPKLFETTIYGQYNDEGDGQQELDTSILKYGVQKIPLLFDCSPYETPEPSSQVADLSLMPSALPRIAGIWTGYFLDHTQKAHGLTMLVIESITNDGQFRGRGEDGEGSVFTKYGDFTGGGVFSISGEIDAISDSIFQVSFTKDYNPDFWTDSTLEIYCEGKLDLRSRTISGEWANPIDNYTNTFEVGQTPVFAYRYRYSQEAFQECAPRARWSFACASVLLKVCRESWSWTYFRARFTEQRRFAELWMKQRRGNRHLLSQDDLDEFKRIERRLNPADCRFYISVNEAKWRNINRCLSAHLNVFCASCNDGLYIAGTRIICLTCTLPDLTVQVNLCAGCIGTTPAIAGFQHETIHPVIKVQRMVHDREIAKLVRKARTALDMSKVIFGAEKLSFHSEVKRCSGCQKMLNAPPCWYCLVCYPYHLICEDCESKQCQSSRGEHNDNHPLVRCQPNVVANEAKILTVEDRLTTLENSTRDRLGRLEQAWEAHQNMVNDRFTSLDGRMTEVQNRLTTMEDLLRMVAAKVMA